jgi:hypothetical protein
LAEQLSWQVLKNIMQQTRIPLVQVTPFIFIDIYFESVGSLH